ncbi:nicotinate-nucleotide--dimethylbenzimidazole phosphoribosyltransferase [Simiduia aestuariiviva]|uniref:Nicotinate-nucleotide--dimethylbenzimidazole phosphoribosyltransferase n=1 Tax=Simiduia aestuariiviva TaxID=1510459 RepID=A0A839USB5_9GAMM|nr:nicotinate-nucleotide--dimethylbenzimidazole phosphoribosyltransferase [Simiduia aestuariiviva]MBB3169591.1 nicotinate-nucleotide--dimethylbenzimidazole phosphoribosyltransferase [Simiduia aestuariiviva]
MQEWFLRPGQAPSEKHRAKAQAWQRQLTKPDGSLGRLESLAVELAALQQRKHPELKKVNICVFASDHGVCAELVSAFPQVVTAQMVNNFINGGAAISVLAKALKAEFEVVSLGTVAPVHEMSAVRDETIARQSGNITCADAMTDGELAQAMDIGREAVARAVETGCELFVAGEMGIGNSTVATAMLARLLDQPAASLAGPGTGLPLNRMAHKIAVIERALAHHRHVKAPLDVLRCLGGFDIAALVASYIACAQAKLPVLVDGYICGVAALTAVCINPSVRPWLLASHRSTEPGHGAVLQALKAEPLLDLGMRLGEGSGAALAVPLLRMACDLHNNMATFNEAGVSEH